MNGNEMVAIESGNSIFRESVSALVKYIAPRTPSYDEGNAKRAKDVS